MERKVKNANAIIQKGDAHLKKAQKASKSGWLKSPNWDDSAFSYRQAIKEYKKSGIDGQKILLQTLIESANAHEKCKSINTAAQNMELAAKIVSKDPEKCQLAHDYYVSSSNYYLTNEQYDKATGLMISAGEVLGKKNPDVAVKTLHESFQIVEDAERILTNSDTMQKAISITLRLEKYKDAVEMFKRLNKMWMETEEPSKKATDIYRNFLSIIVIRFHEQDYKHAEEEFKEAQLYDLFSASEEGQTAESMISAYRSASEEDFNACITLKVFHYLPNQVSRIVKKLTLSEDVLANGPTETKHDDGTSGVDGVDGVGADDDDDDDDFDPDEGDFDPR